MWHAYRLNDNKDWVKMKDFNTLEEYKEYIEKKNIIWSKCFSEEAFQKYGKTAISPAAEGDFTE